jgi:exodeoxyribonuclease-1
MLMPSINGVLQIAHDSGDAGDPFPNTQTAASTFLWYDLETTGTDPRFDRIVQFAGVRTDLSLNEVEAPFTTYIHWPIDVLPEPSACAVTGLTPQRVNREAMPELEAYVAINRAFSRPNTCVVGFNNLRFDDEFVRHAFYRHLLDPYAREWQSGNSRWDVIDLARAAAALRPEGIEWPIDAGLPSFRLEELTAANGIAHADAHDALSDVRATVGVARLIRAKQRRLFDYYYRLRDRAMARERLTPERPQVCLHVSRMFARERHCIAPVMTLARHPTNRSSVIVADLSKDVSALIEWDADRLREALFGVERDERPGLKEVRLNRCPFVAPLSVLREEDKRRLGLDMGAVSARFDELKRHGELADKIAAVYVRDREFRPRDVDEGLYDGFLEDADRLRATRAVAEILGGAMNVAIEFDDARLGELLFRMRARRDPAALSAPEYGRWLDFVAAKMIDGIDGRMTLAQFRSALGELEAPDALISELAAHADTLDRLLSRPGLAVPV